MEEAGGFFFFGLLWIVHLKTLQYKMMPFIRNIQNKMYVASESK